MQPPSKSLSKAVRNFYVTGGTLHSNAPSYVERSADHQLYEGLLAGEFCYVLTARQMGKSSLMVRTADRLQNAGVHVVSLDLTAVGGQNVIAEQWYFGLLDVLGGALGLEEELQQFWVENPEFGPFRRFMKAIREVVLPRLGLADETVRSECSEAPQSVPHKGLEPETGPDQSSQSKVRLVIFLDEIDFTRSLPFSTDEFFAGIRECYNRRTTDSMYECLTFCLMGVASPSDLIRDTRMTPFNIGRRIELNDFTSEEAMPLVEGLRGKGANGIQYLRRVLFWTGGHPYLTQRLCLAVAAKPGPIQVGDVDELCEDLFLSDRARERDDNLMFVRDRLLRNEPESAPVLNLYARVLKARRGLAAEETNSNVTPLRLSGIVRSERGKLFVRNRIYERAFDQLWVDNHLPQAELRRQRESYLRILVRVGTTAAIVLIAMAVLVVWALRSRNKARDATWTALRQQAQLVRVGEAAGHRFSALESIREAAKIKASSDLRDDAIVSLATPDLRWEPVRNLSAPNAASRGFSSDLQLYAACTPEGEVVLRRTSNDVETARWRVGTSPVKRVWFSSDKQSIAIGQVEKDLTVLSFWRPPFHQALFALTNRMLLEAFDFSPDGNQIAIGDTDGTLRTLSLPDGELRSEINLYASCSALRFDPEGRRIAVASVDSLKIKVFNASLGDPVNTLHSASPLEHLAWHPDGRILAGTCEDQRIRMWEVEMDEFAKVELPKVPGPISALAFSHHGDLLASATSDHSVRLWDTARGRLVLTLAESGDVDEVQFGTDDRRLGVAGPTGMIRFMEVASGEECRTLADASAEDIHSLDIHPDGRLLAVAHAGGITFWDLANSQNLGHMPVGDTSALRFDSKSGDLVDAEFRGTYCFALSRNLSGIPPALALKPKENFYLPSGAMDVDFALRAAVLAVAYSDRVRLANNTNSAFAVVDEKLGEPGFKTVALSPNGLLVAAANWIRGEVWVWRSNPGSKPRRLMVGGEAFVRFSPDGQSLAIGTMRQVTLWDTQTWEPRFSVDRAIGTTGPTPIAFCANGLIWAIAWSDASVRLLDMNGRNLGGFERTERETVVDLAVTPDGSKLVSATSARTVLVWDLRSVARDLAELGISSDFKLSAVPKQSEARLTLNIGSLDRLRFSQARYVLGLRRDIAELNHLIRQDPGVWYYYYHLAEKHRQLGEFESAIQDYDAWIEIDRTKDEKKSPEDRAWPLRDLALLLLSGPPKVQYYERALALTREALQFDCDNVDNKLRHGIACYRNGLYEEAALYFGEVHALKDRSETSDEKVAAALFYEAMCQAHQNDIGSASQLLQQARRVYEQADLVQQSQQAFEATGTDRKTSIDQLSHLLWEAERVVNTSSRGG